MYNPHLSVAYTSRLPYGYQTLQGKCMEVTKLPGIKEEVICTIHILVLLLQVGYQMITKLYRENVWKLPSYQVTRYKRGSNMYNPYLSVAFTSQLPNGYQALQGKCIEVTKFTRLPDITEEVICTIHPCYGYNNSVTKWLPSFIGKM